MDGAAVDAGNGQQYMQQPVNTGSLSAQQLQEMQLQAQRDQQARQVQEQQVIPRKASPRAAATAAAAQINKQARLAHGAPALAAEQHATQVQQQQVQGAKGMFV